MTSNGEPMITEKDVIERLRARGIRVSNQTIWKLRKKGSFPLPFKMGGDTGRNYYYLKDIEAFEKGEWKPVQA